MVSVILNINAHLSHVYCSFITLLLDFRSEIASQEVIVSAKDSKLNDATALLESLKSEHQLLIEEKTQRIQELESQADRLRIELVGKEEARSLVGTIILNSVQCKVD